MKESASGQRCGPSTGGGSEHLQALAHKAIWGSSPDGHSGVCCVPKGLCSQSHESLHDFGACDLVAKKQTEPVMT